MASRCAGPAAHGTRTLPAAEAQRGLRGSVELLENARDVPAEQGVEECSVLVGCAVGDQLLDEALGVGRLSHGAQPIILMRSLLALKQGRAGSAATYRPSPTSPLRRPES